MHTKKIQDSLMATSCIRIFILLLSSSFCKSSDQLTHTKPLFPSDELISKGGDFALGFFSPASSNSSLHLGIWYNNIPERTYVWVANRDNPITAAPSTALAITNSSDMVLLDPNGHSVWTTMSNSIARGAGAYAVLLDSGNFVLQLPNGTETWQSFDHPTDTILPTMRFVLSYKDKAVGRLVSWKSPDNPSSGDFSYSSDPSAPTLQAFAWHGIRPYYRNGVANDASVISAGKYLPNRSSMLFETEAELRDEFYFVFTVSPGSPFMHMTLDYKGWFKLLVWNTHSSSWTSFYERPTNTFDLYASCGPYGYSDFTVAPMACRCLDGFEPNGLNFSRGCRRIEELECDKQSQFVTLREMRVPDKFLHIMNRSFDECTAECSNNCSCTAYAYANLSKIGAMGDSSRCLVWSGELIDVAKLRGGEPLYLRLAGSHDKTRSSIKIVLPIIACLMLLTCVALDLQIQRQTAQERNPEENGAGIL
ncbi:hypothetical protein BRADI_5g23040v3 [Brachypodium distachyon]|uniref:non-specific serine/threonine protein kinase n=1 Tax=Brachypodium distachyon TaxID=15368 RepID=A0A2K2CIR6_BRADI|nr:hypothetical protein BRADI_5g23040v3 [Brachypodium distachyon]